MVQPAAGHFWSKTEWAYDNGCSTILVLKFATLCAVNISSFKAVRDEMEKNIVTNI